MLHTPASPYASSSVASTYEVKSAPLPPHSGGTHTPNSPSAPALRTVSSGTVAVRSHSAANGAISLRTKSRVASRMARCSSVRRRMGPEHSTGVVIPSLPRMALHIGVVGEGVCSRAIARSAERVGTAIARAGAVLLCGGRTGVMEAASRGAARAGGTVVGVLPGFSRRDANRWVTIPIVTGMDQARNVVLVRSCDAVIAVGGSYGTLSEIALALKLGVPIVGLRTWRLAPPVARRVPVLRARNAEDAVRLAVGAARRHAGRRARTWLS